MTENPTSDIKLLSVKKIWDNAPHNALTDLIRYRNCWYCVFRESDEHVYGKDGVIRILQSKDGEKWVSIALLEEKDVDLRDPKFSISPDHKLLLLAGGSVYDKDKNYITRQPRVTFSDDGEHWGTFQDILESHEWLWRLTWHQGKGYGASYSFSDPKKPREEWLIKLFETQDGVHYRMVTQWDIYGNPNETTLRFFSDGTMVALVRREKPKDNNAWIGHSKPPYTNWSWKETEHHFGGPNFLILPNGSMLAAGRIVERNPYGVFEKTMLAKMTLDNLQPVLMLPSGGRDCSYPGMVYHDGILWVCYYSSHEGQTAIYLAKIILS